MHITGTGIDIVEITRFAGWESRDKKQLLEVFSQSEIAQAQIMRTPGRIYEFFASRFAAKEAFYKALSASLVGLGLTQKTFSFAFARKHVAVVKGVWDVPVLQVNWAAFNEKIGVELPTFEVQLSIAHEKSCAVAMVVLSTIGPSAC